MKTKADEVGFVDSNEANWHYKLRKCRIDRNVNVDIRNTQKIKPNCTPVYKVTSNFEFDDQTVEFAGIVVSNLDEIGEALFSGKYNAHSYHTFYAYCVSSSNQILLFETLEDLKKSLNDRLIFVKS